MQKGDRIVALDGQPFIGASQLSKALTDVHPGIPMRVTLMPADPARGGMRTIALPVVPAHALSWDAASDFSLSIVLPGVSLLLGFWVAFRRPRDPMAWLLLLLMLSFPHILQTFIVEG